MPEYTLHPIEKPPPLRRDHWIVYPAYAISLAVFGASLWFTDSTWGLIGYGAGFLGTLGLLVESLWRRKKLARRSEQIDHKTEDGPTG